MFNVYQAEFACLCIFHQLQSIRLYHSPMIFPNNSVRFSTMKLKIGMLCIIKLKVDMLYHMNKTF